MGEGKRPGIQIVEHPEAASAGLAGVEDIPARREGEDSRDPRDDRGELAHRTGAGYRRALKPEDGQRNQRDNDERDGSDA